MNLRHEQNVFGIFSMHRRLSRFQICRVHQSPGAESAVQLSDPTYLSRAPTTRSLNYHRGGRPFLTTL